VAEPLFQVPLYGSDADLSRWETNYVEFGGVLRANYWFQKLRTNDWAYDNANPTSSTNMLLTGQQSPNYTANVFCISIAYTGW
jgi:hypothetical protein